MKTDTPLTDAILNATRPKNDDEMRRIYDLARQLERLLKASLTALDAAELALRIVPARSKDDAWMELLQETQIVPALEAINKVRVLLPE